ncbi:hypothetical protein [Nostoc sp.]|uniref:hypothetical protein n=1 Tax=Nostoc sp. TaxID=1180 RepID=UPI002FF7697E
MTRLQKAKKAVFIKFSNVLQQLSKLILCILLASILSIAEIILPNIPLTRHGVAEAVPINKYISSLQVDKTLTVLEKASNFIATGSSFIPDISI